MDQARPFRGSIDAFFRLMLPDVPPSPEWLHGIAMVGSDYLRDEGQGWDRDVAKFDLVRSLRKQVKAHDAETVFLSSGDIGVFGLVDAIGYAMVADGNYQDSWCDPSGRSFALFPNWRNTSWSYSWWAITNVNRTKRPLCTRRQSCTQLDVLRAISRTHRSLAGYS